MKALLIPVKNPERCKTRLSGLISPEERRKLAWAMFEDVSAAVCEALVPDRVFLVSNYQPAIEKAESMRWEVLIEESQTSESSSVDWASSILAQTGFDLVMRLPADIPLVGAEDIDGLMAADLRMPAALLVPSDEGTGTNAIIRTPPDLFPSRFGPGSLLLHQQEAKRVGVECVVVENPRIALDIDEPADLNQLLNKGRGTRTFDLLSRMQIAEVLQRASAGSVGGCD